MSSFRSLPIALAISAIVAPFDSLQADSLRPLPAAFKLVRDCDDACRVVVGQAVTAEGRVAVRWTPDEGMRVVCRLGADSDAMVVSDDGSTIAGDFGRAGGDAMFLWREGTGTIDAGAPGMGIAPFPIVDLGDISADGEVIVGSGRFTDWETHAFRTTFDAARRQEYQDLGTLGGEWSFAYFVSADGEVVVGVSTVASGDFHLFRWTNATGMVDLGSLEGRYLQVDDISEDGSVIVGTAQNARRASVPFIAGPNSSVTALPLFEDVAASGVLVSDDGKRIYGDVRIRGAGASSIAFRYRPSETEYLFFDPLVENGWVDVGGSSPRPRTVSGDGRVVSGWAEGTRELAEPYLRVQGRMNSDVTPVRRILHKVFESPKLSEFSARLVRLLSDDGRTFLLQVNGAPYRFVHVQVDDYPRVIDENLFASRPLRDEVAFWTVQSVSDAAELRDANEDVEGTTEAYGHAALAQTYQDLCASLTLDGIDDPRTRKRYAEYRYLAAVQSYTAYLYAYQVYTSTGGLAEFSAETLAASYYAYDYQRLDLEEFLGGE